jgi:uncharacterized protein
LEILGYLSSILIGISLGLIGGGGSILAIPIVVYLFKVEPVVATSYSLFIVGISSLIGTKRHYNSGNLKINTALFFALPSVMSILLTRKIIVPIIPEQIFRFNQFILTKNILMMVIFAILMIAASVSMIRQQQYKVEETKTPNTFQLMMYGFLIGIITGFLGAGGGFLIIPVLIFFAKLEMKQAVGTSLLIISINSLLGFVGDIINHVVINWVLLGSISFFAIIGMFIGTQLSKNISGDKLKPLFGWFVLMMGLYIFIKELLF